MTNASWSPLHGFEVVTSSSTTVTMTSSSTIRMGPTPGSQSVTFTTASKARTEVTGGQLPPPSSHVTFSTTELPTGPALVRPSLPPSVANGMGPGRAGRCIDRLQPLPPPGDTGRRRSQSNEFGEDTRSRNSERAGIRRMEDRLFELTMWIKTRKDVIATRLIGVETTLSEASQPGEISPVWAKS